MLIAVLCGGVALGCGGEPGATPVAADGPPWDTEISEACTALNEQHSELTSMEPDDLPGARRHAAAVAAFTAGYAELFETAEDPSHDPAVGRAVRRLAARFADAGRELDEAARADDAAAAERAVRRLDQKAAALDVLLATWDVEPCRTFGDVAVTTP